jgi:hypothetical protein
MKILSLMVIGLTGATALANEGLANLREYRSWLQKNFGQMVEDIYRSAARDVFTTHFQNFRALEERVQEKVLRSVRVLDATQQALENFQGVAPADYIRDDYWDLTLVQQNAHFAQQELAESAAIFDRLVGEQENGCTAELHTSLALSYGLWFNFDVPQFKFDPRGAWAHPTLPRDFGGQEGASMQGAAESFGTSEGGTFYRTAFSSVTTAYGVFESFPVISVVASALSIYWGYQDYRRRIKEYNRNVQEARQLYHEFEQIAAEQIALAKAHLPAIIQEECQQAARESGALLAARYGDDYTPAQLAQVIHQQHRDAQVALRKLDAHLDQYKALLAAHYAALPAQAAQQRAAWMAQVPGALDFTYKQAVHQGQKWGTHLRKVVLPALNDLARAQQQQRMSAIIEKNQQLLQLIHAAAQNFGPARAHQLEEKILPQIAQGLGPGHRQAI